MSQPGGHGGPRGTRFARRRLTMRLGLLVVALLAALGAPASATAAPPLFGTPSVTSTFGSGIEFRQPVVYGSPLAHVELLLEAPMAPGPQVAVIAVPPPGTLTLRHTLDSSNGALLPNTALTARWRLTSADGAIAIGPSVSVRYDDTRFTWQTRTGPVVRVHWYEGGAAFGDRALQIGEDSVARAGRLLGVTETQPVDFFIYADQQAFYGALGPGTRENVGGQAVAELRTLYALITPSEITAPWVGTVIPHELTHLVFDTAVRNPYHFPPRWLNEGLAVYLSQGYGSSDKTSVAAAVQSGTLMPLPAIASQFPTTRERFSLAYAESVSAVDYLVRQKGESTLVALIRSYSAGVTDDEAFVAALALDVAGFDSAWRASLGAKDPVAYGPRPAPSGPLPAPWLVPSSGGSATSAPAAASLSSPGVPATESPAAPTGDGGRSFGLALTGALVLAVGIGIAIVLLALRIQQPPMTGPR